MPRFTPVVALGLALTTGLLATGTAAAAPLNVATQLPAGQVACISLKDATNYTDYSKKAPEFAADLINRAACFKAKESMDAVLLGQEKGYARVKLLSGHIVYYPAETAAKSSH